MAYFKSAFPHTPHNSSEHRRNCCSAAAPICHRGNFLDMHSGPNYRDLKLTVLNCLHATEN